MDPDGEAVPFEVVMSGNHSGHSEAAITVFGSLDAWLDHWEHMHEGRHPHFDPDLSGRVLVEVAGGWTGTGMARLEVTKLVWEHETLRIEARVRYPAGPSTADIGNPFVVLTTPAFEGALSLSLSVM
jgi:hypothetical protein